MYLWMASAAVLPAPIAKITVAAPVTTSPPANTPGREVAPNSSATIPPHRCVSRPVVVDLIKGLGEVPIDIMTVSAGITSSLSAFSTGRRRPESSGSPNSISTQRTPATQRLSSPVISTGLVRKQKRIPSSLACSTSSARAGNSSAERR